MKIVDSNVKLASEHEATKQTQVRARFTQSFSQVLAAQEEKPQESRERLVKMLESLVEAILAAMEGRKCRTPFAACRPPERTEATPQPAGGREIAWSSEILTREFEHERTTVAGKGQVRTADGRCIAFELCVDMERQYESERVSAESGKVVLRDPLVVNFAGNAAALSGERIDFDLDGDGCAEKIPGLSGACGYLVLDRNRNGRVDDGSELFGASSGDGFADLAALDADANGWIDEADPAFANLFTWDGRREQRTLETLASSQVGALWTGVVASAFDLKDNANQLLGQIRSTGLWLAEDGRVGSLQQVDLALAETPVPRGTAVQEEA